MKLFRLPAIVAIATGAVALAVYLATLAPTVLPGDSGEFQFAAPLLGLAHPTGYPLYLLLGKLWTLVAPLGDLAYRMNLLSAVLSAATVAALFVLARRLGMGSGPALVAALTLAFSLTFWSQAVRAEVYALNSLFTVLLLIVALRRGDALPQPAPPPTRLGSTANAGPVLAAYLLPFLFGLALTHHRMVLLLAPALLVLAWQEPPSAPLPARERLGEGGSGQPANAASSPHGSNGDQVLPLSPQGEGAGVAIPGRVVAVLLILAPLLLYLYIPLRAGATPYVRLPVGGGPDLLTYDNTLPGFLAWISGSVFGPSLGFGGAEGLAQRLGAAFDLLRQQVGSAGIALAIVGLLVLARRQRRVALALVLAYGGVVAFCLFYTIGDIADLYTPSYIIVALCIGAAVQFLGEIAARLLHHGGASLGVTLAALLLPLSLFGGNLGRVDLSGQTDTRAAWEGLLAQPMPAGAILVSNDRDEITPMWYMQYVEKRRPDLIGLFPKIRPETDYATLGGLLDWLLRRGQQPYLIKPMPGLEIKYRVQVERGLPQVTGWAAPSPPQPQRASQAELAGALRLLGADVADRAAPGAGITVTLYWTPLAALSEDYHSFVQILSAGGERVAGSDARPGAQYYPTSQWQRGDVLADRHEVALPASLAAGAYQVRAGLYRYPSLQRLAIAPGNETLIDLGTIEVR